jgi:SAM-dependent methyltransferase
MGSRFPNDATVLDARCGFGRNAIALTAKGLAVVSADKDCGRLDSLKKAVAELESSKQTRLRILPVCADLSNNRWPFVRLSFSAVVCVHYLVQEIIEYLKSSLREGGYIYIETFGDQGGNYLQLPKAGELRAALAGYDLDELLQGLSGFRRQTGSACQQATRRHSGRLLSDLLRGALLGAR